MDRRLLFVVCSYGAFAALVAPVAMALEDDRPVVAHDRTASAWWRGLGPARQSAEARGIVALRAPTEGRSRIVGTTFRMGSTREEMARAMELCRREVLAPGCEEDPYANLVRAEGHAHDVTLFTFDMDRTEVTVRAYARCVEAGVCAPPGFSPSDPRFSRPNLPVVLVRWEDASTYCGWVGGRLPTEAEWELAARGAERRAFPWGMNYNPRLCNHGSFAEDQTDATDGFQGLAPVGSFPDGATPSGLLDMAGNAAEWVADIWGTDEENYGYEAAPRVNPKGPTESCTGLHCVQPSGWHVVRGGSFLEGATRVRGAARAYTVYLRSESIGFRCAYDP